MDEVDYREGIYDTYASVSSLSHPLQSKYQSMLHNIAPHLGAEGSILDIGSGQGEFLEMCRDLGYSAEGIDASAELAEACQQRGLSVTLISDLPAFLKACSRQYAFVSMIDVLEHFTRIEAFEILHLIHSRVLHPDGRLIVQAPNMQSPFASLNLYHDLTHEWGYTESSLAQLLRSTGFRQVHLFPHNYPTRGLYMFRHVLRSVFYLLLWIGLVIDQPNRGRILTPNLIAVAEA
jgi:O-antigen chain-terminating methyltransferase